MGLGATTDTLIVGHSAPDGDKADPPAKATVGRDGWQNGVYLACGCGGYVFYLAWFFLMVISPSFSLSGAVDTASSFTFHGVFFAVTSISMLAAWIFSDLLSSRAGGVILTVGTIALAPAAPLAALLGFDAAYAFAGWALSGIGCVCAMMIAVPFLGTLNHRRLLLCTSGSFALSICLAIGTYYMIEQAKLVAISLMPLVAASLFWFVRQQFHAEHVPLVRAKESSSRNPISWKSLGAALGHSMCLGFAVYSCTSAVNDPTNLFVLASAVAALAAAVAMAADGVMGKGTLNSEKNQLKFFLPSAAVGLLPMPFLGSGGRLFCCIVLFLVFIPQAITNINAVAESVYLCRLAPIRTFAGARIANIVGLLLGYAIGFSAFGNGAGQSSTRSIVVLLVLLFVLITLATFLFQDRYPSESPQEQADDEDRENGKYKWKARCYRFAEQIDLSPRQTEVLLLLSRGYSTKYIEDHLVISSHTVKSHIYSIYQKADVHSKQEIIELIEDVDMGECG